MHDILDYLDVVVPPAFSCGEFEVSATVVLECQDLVARGCPGLTPYDEEEALYYASLMDHRSLEAVRSAWDEDQDARELGEDAALRRFLQQTIGQSVSFALAEPFPPA